MLHVILDDTPWFEPKRYGYGAGLPCAWQGWALLVAYLLVVLGAGIGWADSPTRPLAVILPATALLVGISWRHTRGGWRWRWGGE